MSQVKIRDFKNIVFFTGAGMSAESGVPTYRGKGGIWKEYNYEEYACQAAFDSNPEKVWEFHNKRREMVAKCAPNEGHRLLAQLEKELDNVTIVTQNIDGFHQKAGAQKVFELHGSLWKIRDDKEGILAETFDAPFTAFKRETGTYWRPHIVWFGDMLHADVVEGAVQAIQNCDLLVSIGTSGVVYPAAGFPDLAKKNGATLVEINPQETAVSHLYDITLRGPATQMLPTLL